jgi:uncharacterized protein (DUF924 family)
VWLQLLDCFAADPDCQPTAVRTVGQQLDKQKALNGKQIASIAAADCGHQQSAAQQQAAADLTADMQQQQLQSWARQQQVVAGQTLVVQ